MKTKWVLSIAATVFGLISGESALMAAQRANPPIDWNTIQYIFIGSVLGMIFVIGIQLLRRDPKYANFAITAMLPVSLYFLSSGVSALSLSSTISPASSTVLVVGVGALTGVGFSSLIYK